MTHPDYNVENTAELIGPLPLVAPPVLADWSVADPDDGWWYSQTLGHTGFGLNDPRGAPR
ncbi:hypothetical protein ACXDF8_03745 [Mycolicibacterium sp. CBM1]